jgi:RimJ/RimL family protein N-acetyltransferase
MLRGKKVLLRAIERRDIESFRQWLNDPEVNQYLLPYIPITEVAEEKWFENMAQSNSGVIMAIESYTLGDQRQLIGNCGFHNINWKDRTATFGIFIGNKSFWSNGYGTEAAKLLIEFGFNQLNLHRINSSVVDFNRRSLKMHQKLGFQVEGCRRLNIFKNGKYHDEVILGLLKDEWERAKKI